MKVFNLGVVVIGRNEGERLRRCLNSVIVQAKVVVYVDSGSSDDSVPLAKSIGAVVVDLDLSTPFTAARARNAGAAHLAAISAGIDYLQFVDGDCELNPGWFETACQMLDDHPEITALAGRLQERFPERSVYNRLGDLEWNQAGFGEVSALGGIFMIRKSAFDDVGGFNPSIPAGEEPELCARLIACGGHLWRINHLMAWHDLAMISFRQWWIRHSRNGYGGLAVTQRCGLSHFKRSLRRARLWATLPMFAIASAWVSTTYWGLLVGLAVGAALLSLWAAQLLRLTVRARLGGHPLSVAVPYAFLTMIAHIPNAQGQLRYLKDRILGRTLRLIEYKAAPKK